MRHRLRLCHAHCSVVKSAFPQAASHSCTGARLQHQDWSCLEAVQAPSSAPSHHFAVCSTLVGSAQRGSPAAVVFCLGLVRRRPSSRMPKTPPAGITRTCRPCRRDPVTEKAPANACNRAAAAKQSAANTAAAKPRAGARGRKQIAEQVTKLCVEPLFHRIHLMRDTNGSGNAARTRRQGECSVGVSCGPTKSVL